MSRDCEPSFKLRAAMADRVAIGHLINSTKRPPMNPKFKVAQIATTAAHQMRIRISSAFICLSPWPLLSQNRPCLSNRLRKNLFFKNRLAFCKKKRTNDSERTNPMAAQSQRVRTRCETLDGIDCYSLDVPFGEPHPRTDLIMTKNELASWVRHIDKQKTRKKFAKWYAGQTDKSRPLVRKVFDLVHWDVVLDAYELDDLLVRYPDPPEGDVADALVQCGYPRSYAETRAKQPIVESRGLRYTGGHYDLRKRNPYVKYWTAYRVI